MLSLSVIYGKEQIKADWKVYEKYLEYKEAYENSKKRNKPARIITGTSVQPPSKTERLKRHMLILDKCQGLNVHTVARAGMLNQLSIAHQHIPVTIYFLQQSWGGVPWTIRLNTAQYFIFTTSDIMQLGQIYSAFANSV